MKVSMVPDKVTDTMVTDTMLQRDPKGSKMMELRSIVFGSMVDFYLQVWPDI